MQKTGDEYFDSKEFRDILAQYEESAKSDHPIFMDADDLTDIADYYNFTGNAEKADQIIDMALELHPGAVSPLVFKAREALQNEDIEKAKDYADQIIDKDDPDYVYTIAEIMVAQDQIEGADTYLRRYASTIPPDEYDNFAADVTNLYVDYGVNDKAYEWGMRITDTSTAEFKEIIGRVMFAIGDFKESGRLFNELIDQDPYSKNYWNALASSQFMEEDYHAAVSSSEYAIAIDPNDADSLLTKANGLYRLNNFQEALKYYRRYNELEPLDEFGELHQGICLMNLNRNEEALEHLQKALEISTSSKEYLFQIYQEMAFVYSALKQPEKALQCIDGTDQLDCDHIDMLVLRGHILMENDRTDEALDFFREAIIQSRNAPAIMLRIIVSMFDNKYLATCYAMFRNFFHSVDDDFNDGYAYMALCCWQLQKTKEFLKYLKEAVRRNPKETKSTLAHLFPPEMEVKDYYEYMYNRFNDLKK